MNGCRGGVWELRSLRFGAAQTGPSIWRCGTLPLAATSADRSTLHSLPPHSPRVSNTCARRAAFIANLSPQTHNVVLLLQSPHNNYVTVQLTAAAATLRRCRRRHRRRFSYLPSSSRILHRERPTFPSMAPSGPQDPASSSHTIRVLIWAATRTATNGTRRRRSERSLGCTPSTTSARSNVTAKGTGAGRTRSRVPRTTGHGQLTYTRAASAR
jgi:hypothetical protein